MSEPDRIWIEDAGSCCNPAIYRTSGKTDPHLTPYVRADLFDAQAQEIARLRETIKGAHDIIRELGR